MPISVDNGTGSVYDDMTEKKLLNASDKASWMGRDAGI
jgi:hypothetical protein